MDNIGAEVGQKMRSAIKAKLMELGCYVDDELPDYIMVMVANKRTTSQMNQDLNLFLGTKTSSFVEWLQIVLKKLKEITVTNPDVYKRVSKQKGSDTAAKSTVKVKKEKKKVKSSKATKFEPSDDVFKPTKSLTDDLPVNANQLTELRKIVVMQDNQNSNNSNEVNEDNFDIPPLSEVTGSNLSELEEIETRINNVKSRLGMKVSSDTDDDDFINLKIEPEDLFPTEKPSILEATSHKVLEQSNRKIQVTEQQSLDVDRDDDTNQEQKAEHPRIIFGNTSENIKKQSVLSRLGKRPSSPSHEHTLLSGLKRTKINLLESRKEEEEILESSVNLRKSSRIQKSDQNVNKKSVEEHKTAPVRKSALKRLGVMSKVAIPHKEPVEEEVKIAQREVSSVIKVKPRVIPPQCKQANKNLLLKAVAEAQRSIAQTPIVGTNAKPDGLFTKKYLEKIGSTDTPLRKLSNTEKNKIRNILVSEEKRKRELSFSSDDENLEYVPKPVKRIHQSDDHLEYIPSSKDQTESDSENVSNLISTETISNKSPLKTSNKPTFIITLDGITKRQDLLKSLPALNLEPNRENNTDEIKKRKSPIIFDVDKFNVPKDNNANVKVIPDRLLPVVSAPYIKTKERCKYWPSCRQGDKCDFVHPSMQCKLFPQCKYGEKCLYIHPVCKFENSCTRKDCPYGHNTKTFSNTLLGQKCKFYPHCTNLHCTFFHPRPCKYGKFCKNQADCNFSHDFKSKNNFTWRSVAQ